MLHKLPRCQVAPLVDKGIIYIISRWIYTFVIVTYSVSFVYRILFLLVALYQNAYTAFLCSAYMLSYKIIMANVMRIFPFLSKHMYEASTRHTPKSLESHELFLPFAPSTSHCSKRWARCTANGSVYGTMCTYELWRVFSLIIRETNLHIRKIF